MNNYWQYRYERDKKINRLFCEKKGVDEKELEKLCKSRWAEFDEFVGSEKFKSVLDFGCGLGFMCRYFGINKYVGVDVVPELIRENRKRYWNYIFIHIPERMELKQNYDLIFCRGVLQHFDNELLQYYLREFKEHCNNLIIFSPRGSVDQELRPENTEAAACLRQKPNMIHSKIVKAGFGIEKISEDLCQVWGVPVE